MTERLIAAGSGGQGALNVGQMIAYAATNKGMNATWLPSYGAEMRGGTANCAVVISDEKISCPMVMSADYCVIMNNASLARFGGTLKSGGCLILDSDMVTDKPARTDIRVYEVPADKIAEEEGNKKGVNMVLLGAFLALSGSIEKEEVFTVINAKFTGRKEKFAEPNRRLVQRGMDYIRANY